MAVTPRPLIFISAVSRELRSARQLVVNTLTFLGYQPIWQDIFGTESGDLREMLGKQIDKCKGVVQLIGKCYGAEPPTPDEKFGRVSYTQFEALYARERGKKVWYLFIGENFPADPCEAETEELQKLQTEYRNRLQSDSHVFHSLTSGEALEASVLKLRDDLGQLRRGVKRWAIAVVALLLMLVGATVWLIKTQSRQTGVMRRESEQVAAIVDRYNKMEQALTRLAEVESQPKQPGEKLSSADQRARAYTILEKELGLPAGSLAKEIPAFALQLYSRADTSPIMRARAAYALRKFDEAEHTSVDGAVQSRQAFENAQEIADTQRKQAIEFYELAGWSAEKRVQYAAAIEHFRDAEKLTDRNRDVAEWSRVQDAIGLLLTDQGKYRDAIEALGSTASVCKLKLGSQDPFTLKVRGDCAVAMMHNGDWAAAGKEFEDTLRLREQSLGPNSPDTLRTKHQFAVLHRLEGKFSEAESQEREVLKSAMAVFGPDRQETLEFRRGLAACLIQEGKWAEAEQQYSEVIEMYQKMLGEEHPETLTSRNDLAALYMDKGKFSEAEALTRDVLRTREKILGAEHPDTLESRNLLANALDAQGKTPESEAEHNKVREIQERTLGPEHPDTINSYQNIAVCLQEEGKYADAEKEYRHAIALEEKVFGSDHPGTLRTRSNLAVLLDAVGRYEEAESETRKIVAAKQKSLGPLHADTLASRNNLADILIHKGKFNEAEVELREVIALKTKALGANHRDTLYSHNGLADALTKQGRCAEAETEARATLEMEQKLLGDEDLGTIDIRNTLANALSCGHKFSEAEAEYGNLIGYEKKVLGPQHPSTLISQVGLLGAFVEQGKDIEREARELLPSIEKVVGATSPEVLRVSYFLARDLARHGKNAEAKQFATSAADGARKILGPDHPDTKKYEKLAADLKANA